MANPGNMGTLIGRLARDPMSFDNKDGSKKVRFTVFADRNYTTSGGARPSDGIPVETFVSKGVQGTGPYDHVHKGDLVALQYTLQMQTYTKNGQPVYELKVVAEEIKFLESRQITQRRLAGRAAEAEKLNTATQGRQAEPVPAQAAASVEVPSDLSALGADLPFGG